MPKLTKQVVETWLLTIEPNKKFHYKQVCAGDYDPSLDGALRKIIHDLKVERKISSTGNELGYYYKIDTIQPIRNINGGGIDYLDIIFPREHGDSEYEFGWEDLLAISPGDLITLAGVSNSAKTTLALNLLADNINFSGGCVLMGNEYVTADKVVSPRFRRRLKLINWATIMDDEGNLKFDLLPVKDKFHDHITKGALNIIDWISMPGNFWEIQGIHDGIKETIGQGICIVVMQKTKGKDYGDGGEFSERLSDFYFTLDFLNQSESLVTIGKVKENKVGKRASGRSWAFATNDGVNLHNIREVVKCKSCYGKGWKQGLPCKDCGKSGYLDK